MPAIENEPQEADVPELAVKGLKAAQMRALQAGYPLVLVRNRQLVRVSGGHITVLKQLRPRKSVSIRTKFAKP